jgi:hypothetical protein
MVKAWWTRTLAKFRARLMRGCSCATTTRRIGSDRESECTESERAEYSGFIEKARRQNKRTVECDREASSIEVKCDSMRDVNKKNKRLQSMEITNKNERSRGPRAADHAARGKRS